MIDINIKSSTLEKAMEYFASMFACLVGPPMLRRKAYHEAIAAKTIAEGQAQVAKIFDQILPPETKATIKMKDPNGLVEAYIPIHEKRKQNNITAIAKKTLRKLPTENERQAKIARHPVDHDWVARFASRAENISDETIQEIFSQILAGQMENPGGVSISTLDVLSKMTKSDAENFTRFANYVLDGEWIYVNPFGADTRSAAGDLSMSDYMDLLNLGLFNESATGVARSLDSADIGLSYLVKLNSDSCLYLKYMNRALKVKSSDKAKERGYTITKDNQIILPALMLSRAGRELIKFVKQEFQEACLEYMATGLHRRMESDVYVAEIDANANYEDITKANFEKIQFVGDKAE